MWNYAFIRQRGVARLAGVEPAARGFEGRCSIQLSYRRVILLVPSPRSRVKRPPGAANRP
jgi:hypothetical protein